MHTDGSTHFSWDDNNVFDVSDIGTATEHIASNEQHILMGGDQVIDYVPLNNTNRITLE